MDNICDCEKYSYDTKSKAQTAAKGIWYEDRVKMNPYKCPEGIGYHLATAGKIKGIRDIPHGLQTILHSLNKKKTKKKK